MGYCPYLCICCGVVVDNGWGNKSYGLDEALELSSSMKYYVEKYESDDRNTLSHCDDGSCLRKLAGDDSSDEEETGEKLQEQFLKIVSRMKELDISLPSEFELYYCVEKVRVERETGEKLSMLKITPHLTVKQAQRCSDFANNGVTDGYKETLTYTSSVIKPEIGTEMRGLNQDFGYECLIDVDNDIE